MGEREREVAEVKGESCAYLAPHQHGSEDHLQAVEEVVPYDDDGSPARGPSLTRADGFYARGSCLEQSTEKKTT